MWLEKADALPSGTVAVVEASKRALDAAGIQFPFPHLQLFVEDVEERVIKKVSRLRQIGGGEAV